MLGGGVDVGQPAQPQVLGADPGEPGDALGAERPLALPDPLLGPGRRRRAGARARRSASPARSAVRRPAGGVGELAEDQRGQPDPGLEVRGPHAADDVATSVVVTAQHGVEVARVAEASRSRRRRLKMPTMPSRCHSGRTCSSSDARRRGRRGRPRHRCGPRAAAPRAIAGGDWRGQPVGHPRHVVPVAARGRRSAPPCSRASKPYGAQGRPAARPASAAVVERVAGRRRGRRARGACSPSR